ncbi:hypothetical protein DFH06DRAFT_1319384 [Mycena polygramma]|nr:hypothetical protein DFH06DRAFT_1319384 [Mycena polygramma]
MFRRRTLVESAARWPGAREGALFQPRVTEKEGKELGTEEGSAVVKMGRNAGSRAVAPGFPALAQLLPVFFFASKTSPASPLTALLLGPGVDYCEAELYSSMGRPLPLFLGAVVHGSLWINNYVLFDLLIVTQQKEASGVAALATLCVLVLISFGVGGGSYRHNAADPVSALWFRSLVRILGSLGVLVLGTAAHPERTEERTGRTDRRM